LIPTGPVPSAFIIDAIDECRSEDDIHLLLEHLVQLLGQQPGLYVMLSSRPQVPIQTYFESSLHTFSAISSEAKEDMNNFIEAQLLSKRESLLWKDSVFCKFEFMLHLRPCSDN
jgi:hypothetical protein